MGMGCPRNASAEARLQIRHEMTAARAASRIPLSNRQESSSSPNIQCQYWRFSQIKVRNDDLSIRPVHKYKEGFMHFNYSPRFHVSVYVFILILKQCLALISSWSYPWRKPGPIFITSSTKKCQSFPIKVPKVPKKVRVSENLKVAAT